VPLEKGALLRRAQEARARAQATRDQIHEGRSRRQVLHDSAYARLVAKQETMPVIEQAKGVIMAQRGCGPEEAFKLLRQASQRANIKLNALAAQIVEHVADDGKDDNVTPLTVGAKRQLRPGTRSRPPAG
jgi:ANTAR domain